jgi:hypothetical protein
VLGSGTGDREAVDQNDRGALPPGEGDYILRPPWLTPEQEQGTTRRYLFSVMLVPFSRLKVPIEVSFRLDHDMLPTRPEQGRARQLTPV